MPNHDIIPEERTNADALHEDVTAEDVTTKDLHVDAHQGATADEQAAIGKRLQNQIRRDAEWNAFTHKHLLSRNMSNNQRSMTCNMCSTEFKMKSLLFFFLQKKVRKISRKKAGIERAQLSTSFSIRWLFSFQPEVGEGRSRGLLSEDSWKGHRKISTNN